MCLYEPVAIYPEARLVKTSHCFENWQAQLEEQTAETLAASAAATAAAARDEELVEDGVDQD